MGHMAAWKIPVEEITGSQSESNILATVEEVTATSPSSSESIKIAGEVSEPSTMELRKKEIQEIIDTSLDKKLRPITEMLADSMECGPGITEIMGGIGYILGLVGVALYFANRKRNINSR
jgi:nickel transport protein